MVALTLSGCDACMKPKTEEVRHLLEKELKVGATRERVDKVMKNAGIPYSYDQFQNRYQSTIFESRCGPYQAVSIYVYFDSSMKMSKVEVFDSYTFL
ncbi:MAG: hypothetical protein JWR21_1838 [Herminiimonas sp.]|nr:hypothetical protein [Herminiimonas sp.]